MFQTREYMKMYFILFITTTAFEQGYSIDESFDIGTLNNIFSLEGWHMDDNNKLNFVNQQIFVNGELKKLSDSLLNYPPSITEENAVEVSSIMYLALGCCCGETLINILLEEKEKDISSLK